MDKIHSKMPFKVGFFCIGAQKCATSWLYYCLKDHPEIRVPPVKREDIYLGGELVQTHGTEWYLDQLKPLKSGQVSGDVSVDYLFNPRSPAAIAEHAPDAKLILSVREPISRALSAYYWNLRRGNVQEMDLGGGMRRVLATAETAERPCLSYDPKTYYVNILARGLYDIQLGRYLEHFPRDQLLVIPFEKIKTDGSKVLECIYRFLEVDSSFRPGRLNRKRRPKQNSYRSFLLRFERDTPNTAFYGRIANLAHQFVCRLGFQRDQPTLPQDVESELCRFYRPHMQNLFELLRDLPHARELWSDVSWERMGIGENRNESDLSFSTEAGSATSERSRKMEE